MSSGTIEIEIFDAGGPKQMAISNEDGGTRVLGAKGSPFRSTLAVFTLNVDQVDELIKTLKEYRPRRTKKRGGHVEKK